MLYYLGMKYRIVMSSVQREFAMERKSPACYIRLHSKTKTFVLTHENSDLVVDKRVYMTAVLRTRNDKIKDDAQKEVKTQKSIASMPKLKF